jgi:DNA replication protein DnaC
MTNITELERDMRQLHLKGMIQTLQARVLQVRQGDMDFLEAFSCLVRDEIDHKRSATIQRRYQLSGLRRRKNLDDFDWTFNPKLPRREIIGLSTCKFIDDREDVLMIGPPGVGKSHIAQALALTALHRDYKVFYREAQDFLPEIHQARELGTITKLKTQLTQAHLVIIDDLFLRKLPDNAADEITELVFNRHEKASTIITSNRPIEDWGKLLGDVVSIGPMLDRIMHRGHLLKFEGKSWRLKEASSRLAKVKTSE